MQTDEEQANYEAESAEAMEMLGVGYDHKIRDESNDRKYFIITPRIVKAYSRNPYDLALWDTIKDIAGENGECYLNTEQLAILSGMSMGKASESRKYWISIGFLKGEVRRDPGYPQPVWHLTVPDLWAQNIQWCEKHPKIADRIGFALSQKSLHHMKPSPHEEGYAPHEEGCAPGETKKNYKKIQKHTGAPEKILGVQASIAGERPTTEEDLEADRRANKKSWPSRDKFAFNPDILAFADLCAMNFGAPRKKDVSLWIMEIGGWVDAGYKADDWVRAVEIVRGYSTPAMSPTGMTKALNLAAHERKTGSKRVNLPPMIVREEKKFITREEAIKRGIITAPGGVK